MAAKLVIKVHPDDRVEVKVEGVNEPAAGAAPGRKLCERLTRQLEEDLGIVAERRYQQDRAQGVELPAEERREQGTTG